MLLNEIERLFGDVSYPGDKARGRNYPNEWESTLHRLQGKNWRQVTVQDFESQGGIIEGIQALSVKGFICFLPGLVRLALTRPNDRYGIVSALLTLLTDPDYLKSSCEHQQQIITALSPERRNFLARFLAEMQEAEPYLCPVLIESAITNLKNGQVASYRQADVEKWAAEATKSMSRPSG